MLSVVVLATDVVRIMPLPPERDPVLLINANAVLALPVSGQGFQAVARHRGQVIEPLGAVEHRQLSMHHWPEAAGQASSGLAVSLFPEVCGRVVRERPDHVVTIYGYRVCVNLHRIAGDGNPRARALRWTRATSTPGRL